MTEHSTMAHATAPGELIPPENHPEVGRKIFKLLEQIITFKSEQGLPAKWHRCYELTRNKHWRNQAKKGVALVTANLLFTHRQRTVAMLTDNNPTFNIAQVGELDPEREEMVNILLHTAEHYWSSTDQQPLLEESVLNGETYGITIEKGRFDPDDEYGMGEVKFELVDPYHFGWFPVKAKYEDCSAALHFWPMTVREARRRWPDKADQVISDKEWINQIGDARLEVNSPLGEKAKGYYTAIAGVIKQIFGSSMGDMTTSDEDDEILIVEAWVKDYSRTTAEGMEYDMYPGNVRCIHTCNGGEVVLDDMPNPSINWEYLDIDQAAQTYLFSRFPFSVTVSIKDTTSHYGMTDMEQLEGLNIEVNKTLSQLSLMKSKASFLKVINPKDSGVDNKEFTNAPGVINPRNSMVATAIKYMDTPQLSPEFAKTLDIYKEYFFLVSGSFDLEQGKTGEGVIAYKAIAALLERVAIMLRSKLRNYHKLIRQRGRMYLSLAMNWYVEQRWISYNVDGQDMTTAITGPDMIIPAKLNVVAGSTMPVSKIQVREEAIELFRMQAIDNEELLKRLDWPSWKEVAARMKMGPIGEFIDRLVQLGLVEEAAQYFHEIATMEAKEFKRKMEKAELIPIPMIMGQQQQLPAPEQQQPPTPIEQSDIEVKHAQAEKVRMETELVREKIATEKIEQEMKLSGIEFDKQKLVIERARLANDIKMSREQNDLQRESIKAQKAQTAKTETKSADKKGQGPYRERGLSSNNKS